MASPSSVFRLRRRDLAKVVLLAVLQAATLGALLLMVRTLVDGMTSGTIQLEAVYRLAALLVAVVLANAALRGVEFTVSERIGYALVRDLRMTMYRHLQGMSIRQLQGRSRGGLLMRFTGDLSILRTWISRGLARGLVSLILLVGGISVVAYLDPRLAVTIGAVLCFGSAALAWVGPSLYRVTRKVRRRRSLLISNVDEQVHALATVQVFGRSSGEYDRLSRQNDAMTQSLFDTASIRGRMLTISSAVGWVAIAAVLVVGAVEVSAGNTSIGAVAAAIIACRQLTGPVRRLGLSYDYWQRAKVSRGKILDFLRSSTRPLDADGLESLRVRRGTIEFRDVSVKGSLDGVTGTVTGGEVLAILGPTGAGKSTLLNVVAGLADPDGGDVFIDGRSVGDFTLRSRFRQIGMVAPDLPLMRGTVRRNLTYRQATATDEEIRRVVMACHLDELLIDELPKGLDTWLTEGGRNVSAGQRQRLALGRALLGNPPILLLDEPTQNLDEASREVFRRVIAHHRGTVMLVTHDAGEAALADHVWSIREGRIVEMVTGQEFRDRLWAVRNQTGSVRAARRPDAGRRG